MTGELLLNQSWSRIEMTIDGWIPEIETKGNEIKIAEHNEFYLQE